MDEEVQYIYEGSAKIYRKGVIGKIDESKETKENETSFYNPSQVFNRDLSLLVLKCYIEMQMNSSFESFNKSQKKEYVKRQIKGLRICEALAATGLRSIRYAKELPSSMLYDITSNDISISAVESMVKNFELNNISKDFIHIEQLDARELLYRGRNVKLEVDNKWDIIDLDPYGTVVPFIDPAIEGCVNNGLLCLTSTDMPILGGNYPNVAFYKYGGIPLKKSYLHEMSLRLLLHRVQMSAATQKKIIKPLLSVSTDFYIRIFVQLIESPLKCSSIAANSSLVFQCKNCDWYTVIPFCAKSYDKKKTNKKEEQESNTEKNQSDQSIIPIDQQPQSNKYRSPELSNYLNTSSCPVCESPIILGGPFYSGPLHSPEFVDALENEIYQSEFSDDNRNDIFNHTIGKNNLYKNSPCILVDDKIDDNQKSNPFEWVTKCESDYRSELETFRFNKLSSKVESRLKGLINAIKEDLPDVPLFFNYSKLCKSLSIKMNKINMIKSALLNLGYNVGIFHRSPYTIKTNASAELVYYILYKLMQYSGEKKELKLAFLKNDDVKSKYELLKIDFETNEKLKNPTKIKNFHVNPEPKWGPGRKAKCRKL